MFKWVLLAVTLSAGSAAADAVEDVIQGQLDAFAAGDTATAFTFASPMIKGMFVTPENFGAMVAQGYPMIWQPDDPRFGARRTLGGSVFQTVILRDAAGGFRAMEYELIQTPEGWLINGVRELRLPEVAA